jgi:hypothetical protein
MEESEGFKRPPICNVCLRDPQEVQSTREKRQLG